MPWKSAAAASARYSDSELASFYDLSKRASAAYAKAEPEAARLAEQYLATAARYPCDWNYGNAVHNGNSILGLLALHEGRKAESVEYLLAAGQTPGSPQLNSFGPSLVLARELAMAAEFEAVASYLECNSAILEGHGHVAGRLADPLSCGPRSDCHLDRAAS